MGDLKVPDRVLQFAHQAWLRLKSRYVGPLQQVADVAVDIPQDHPPPLIDMIHLRDIVVHLLKFVAQLFVVHHFPSLSVLLALTVAAGVALAASLLINDSRLPALRAQVADLEPLAY